MLRQQTENRGQFLCVGVNDLLCNGIALPVRFKHNRSKGGDICLSFVIQIGETCPNIAYSRFQQLDDQRLFPFAIQRTKCMINSVTSVVVAATTFIE